MVTERLTLSGDVLENQALGRVLDVLNDHGVHFRTRRFKVGEFMDQPTFVELHLSAPDVTTMRRALQACAPYGALFSLEDVRLAVADMDGVFPEEFYSTTNFTTHIHHKGHFIEVENMEMDCGIRVWQDGERLRAATCPMHRVKAGGQFVVGMEGVRVTPVDEDLRDDTEFRFMSSEISSERPKRRMIEHAAEAIRRAREQGKRVLFVGGPAIIHSGSGPLLARLIKEGWVNVLFAGNALAAHDIESNMLGTSLGVDLSSGISATHGHTHHLRAINRVRRCGSIAKAVEEGFINGGVMWTCVKLGVPFMLAGSIRDDGPLPDVIRDGLEAQDVMRAHLAGVGVCLMVATTLHSVAVGNILPGHVKVYCVDSDVDAVIKLTDRGTHQAIGLATDCEYFLSSLTAELCGPTSTSGP
jgi:lysine-ketoglutarate reductase/saccharopine dehydrogenase-like protein (TIGR00300 family)